MMIKLL